MRRKGEGHICYQAFEVHILFPNELRLERKGNQEGRDNEANLDAESAKQRGEMAERQNVSKRAQNADGFGCR